MIESIKAIFFGIVEGITEWLPISSTGHMIILDEFVKLNVREEFWNLFLVVIQLGAILAVVLLFWNQIAIVLACLLIVFYSESLYHPTSKHIFLQVVIHNDIQA